MTGLQNGCIPTLKIINQINKFIPAHFTQPVAVIATSLLGLSTF